MKLRYERLWVCGALATAAFLKFILLAIQAVPFNSDEAIVGLMARHILHGEKPVFFYGQAYMGSLDAWLVAGAFRILGDQVMVIRIVQILLYMLYLVSLWKLAQVIFTSRLIPVITIWIAAIPTVLVTTYTTATLGGYGETILFGNLILWLGYEVTFGRWSTAWLAWLALGAVGGLAFWTLGLAGIYLLPVVIVGLRGFYIDLNSCYQGSTVKQSFYFLRTKILLYLLAAVAFMIASSPWWLYNLNNSGEAMAILTGTSSLSLASLTFWQRFIGFLLIGIPGLLGFRFPWSPDLSPWPVLVISVMIYLGATSYLAWGIRRGQPAMAPGARLLLGCFMLIFFVFFLGTHFGVDATGRYFLPMYVPLTFALAAFVEAAWKRKQLLGIGLLLIILAISGFETTRAAASPDRITTQFDPITRFDNRYDNELMTFLQTQGETNGYSNYWVSFRLAYLSDEEIIYVARLPDKADLSYTPAYNRYPAYNQIVSASQRVAYITSKHPQLDRIIREGLLSLNVAFVEKQIGDYHIFFSLSRLVHPEELGLGMKRP